MVVETLVVFLVKGNARCLNSASISSSLYSCRSATVQPVRGTGRRWTVVVVGGPSGGSGNVALGGGGFGL